MKTYNLSFGKVNILREDLAEIIVDQCVDLSVEQICEGEEFLITHLEAPFSLLFNKVNHYSYQFDAQMKMGNYKQLNAVAIVCYDDKSKSLTSLNRAFRQSMPNAVQVESSIFSSRYDALIWLESEQEKVKKRKVGGLLKDG